MNFYRANIQDIIGALDLIEWRTSMRIREIISESPGGATVLESAFQVTLNELVQCGEVEGREDEEVGWIFKIPVSQEEVMNSRR